MPDGSPVLDYLVDLKAHLSVGPPVMFVVNSTQLDYSDPAVQNALCGGQGCNSDSLQAQVQGILDTVTLLGNLRKCHFLRLTLQPMLVCCITL